MIVIPNSEIRLLSNVSLLNTYEHQMRFDSVVEQTAFFLSKDTHTFPNNTYIKADDGSVKVGKGRDKLYNCNYMMWRNTEFGDKWFYGFITHLEYINPDVTKVHFEIDVWQTWCFQVSIKESFVEREHRNRWYSPGNPVLNTTDEGLDYGTEYKTVAVTQYVPFSTVFWLVIVCTETMHGGSSDPKEITPSLNGSIQPLTYYLHPFKMDGTSPKVEIMGIDIGINTVSSVLKNLYKQTGAVKNVVSLYITEYPGVDIPYVNGVLQLADMSNFEHVTIQDDSSSMNTLYVKKVANYENLEKNFGDKYGGFTMPEESKLLMHPYTVTVLTDLKGNQKEFKNEYIQGTDLILNVKGSMGVSNKVSYNVKNYNMTELAVMNGDEVALENGLINNSPNDVPIITDLLSAYLQGNRNQLENQKNSIMFNQISGVIGGAVNKSLGGVVGAAGGGYLEMQGLLAKQQDINNTPSQISKMGGNTAFDFGNGYKGVYIIKKEITPEYRQKLSDYFKMFGYKLNELRIPNLATRQHFNFIKTTSINAFGNIPQDDMARIKTMFNSGVTFWHGDYVGDYSLANNEV